MGRSLALLAVVSGALGCSRADQSNRPLSMVGPGPKADAGPDVPPDAGADASGLVTYALDLPRRRRGPARRRLHAVSASRRLGAIPRDTFDECGCSRR